MMPLADDVVVPIITERDSRTNIYIRYFLMYTSQKFSNEEDTAVDL